MKHRFSSLLLVLAVGLSLVLVVQAGVAPAQQVGSEVIETSTLVTVEVLEAKLEEVKASQGIDEETRQRVTEIYTKLRSELELVGSYAEKEAGFTQARDSAGPEAKAIREALDQRRRVPPYEELGLDESAALEDLEARLLKEKADLAAVDARYQDIKQQLELESGRPDAVRLRLTEARKRQQELAAQSKLAPPEGRHPMLIQAQAWRLEAQGRARSAELKMLDAELLSQPARLELLKVQSDQQHGRVEHLSGRVRYLEGLASKRRLAQADEATQAAVVAQQQARGKHSLLVEAAAENAELSQTLAAATAELERLSALDDGLKLQAETIDGEFRDVRKELEVVGLSEALGQVLLQQLRGLPEEKQLAREVERRERVIGEVSLRQIKQTQRRKSLQHLDARLERLLAESPAPLPASEADAIKAELLELLQHQREVLDRLLAVDQASLKALRELELAQTSLVTSAGSFREFLSERLLWIRSSTVLGLSTLIELVPQSRVLFSAERWSGVATKLWAVGPYTPALVLGLLVFVMMLLLRGRLRERIKDSGTRVGKASTDRISETLWALLLTVLLAATGPFLMALLGWQLVQVSSVDSFEQGVGEALLWLAPVYFHLRFFRVVCRNEGIAVIHFRWPEEGVRRLRRELSLLMWTFLPVGFITATVVVGDSTALGGAWGRVGLILMMLFLAVFGWRMFRRNGGVLGPFVEWAPQSLLARWQRMWLLIATGLPLGLAGLAVAGYGYSVLTLATHLLDTVWLVIALVVLQQVVLRWLLISRRRIALRIALERREARREEARREAAGEEPEPAPVIDDEAIDVVALSQESRKLVNLALFITALASLWAIWRDVVPAFALLEGIELWSRTVLVAGEETLVAVTLSDVTLALLVVVFTVLAAKRVPALIEIILLELFQMGPGGRYTVTTLTGYLIAAGGVLYVLALIGADWSKLQWLVAALGVGIGFGLQEIVANFISGLIILFERPIRVGDVVTVGDVDGTVTRIRIRATTIRNWDNKELLVPNKEFITSRLLNWSLSDSVTRVIIRVGIAYGSDVRRASDLMLEAAAHHSAVLEDPRPSVIFEAFGASSLDLVLRCFVGDLDQRIRTLSQLNAAINDKFAAAGIRIAFPQQDVHLDALGPLDVRIQRDAGGDSQR